MGDDSTIAWSVICALVHSEKSENSHSSVERIFGSLNYSRICGRMLNRPSYSSDLYRVFGFNEMPKTSSWNLQQLFATWIPFIHLKILNQRMSLINTFFYSFIFPFPIHSMNERKIQKLFFYCRCNLTAIYPTLLSSSITFLRYFIFSAP